MDRTTFIREMKQRGFVPHPKNEDVIVGSVEFVGPTLQVEYDDDQRPSGIVEGPKRPHKGELSFFVTPVEIDAEFHFRAAILGDWGANEYVHVLEPGPYHDHVFFNIHDDCDLVTVEDLIDAEDFDPSTLRGVYLEEAYQNVSKQTRLEWQPFFQNPIARSLTEFCEGMVVAKK